MPEFLSPVPSPNPSELARGADESNPIRDETPQDVDLCYNAIGAAAWHQLKLNIATMTFSPRIFVDRQQ